MTHSAPATRWRDYLELCKPGVVALMLLTAGVGMCMASEELPHWSLLLAAGLGIGLCAASAAVINHLVDQPIDERMGRTRERPLPRRRLARSHAAWFAAVLGAAGAGALFYGTNALTAWLTIGSLIGYALVYTVYLKHATPQNIVIGGLAGSTPPLLGWTAVTNRIEPDALLLVMIIFVWTPPHFWALALCRHKDYAAAGVPMLPVSHGHGHTRLQILLYTLLLLAASLLPFATGLSGALYLVAALGLGMGFFWWVLKLWRRRDEVAAMDVFRYSITYLGLLFAAMLADHYLV